MKAILKLKAFFSKTEKGKPKSKKDAEIKYNATLFFQLGLIISITVTAFVINAAYAVSGNKIATPDYREHQEEVFYDFTIKLPENKTTVPEKEQPKKRIIPDKLIITKKLVENIKQPEFTSEPHGDEGVIKNHQPASKPDDNDDNKVHNPLGVERVPVFPGCEYLTDNNERRECMSNKLHKIISRRFNTTLASGLDLKGNQRIDVSFIINKNGRVSDVKIRAPHPKLEKEARRVIGLVPEMLPGMQNNKEVAVMFNLPILLDIKDY